MTGYPLPSPQTAKVRLGYCVVKCVSFLIASASSIIGYDSFDSMRNGWFARSGLLYRIEADGFFVFKTGFPLRFLAAG